MARVRPHVKVHLSVADHRKTSAVWADVVKRGMLVELWRKAGEKFAGRTGDRVSLKPTDRMDIAGTTIQAEADRAVTGLCSDLGYELRTYPNRWDVRIRKFSKKQGFQGEELSTKADGKVQRTSPSDSDSESDTNSDTERKSAPAPRAPRARPSSPRTRCPDQLEPEQRDAIRAWATEQGIDLASLRPEWEAHRDHWRAESKLRADWAASFRSWLRKAKAFAARDQAALLPRESAAQARERRTKEAMVEAFRRGEAAEGRTVEVPPLLALDGGRR